MPCIKHPANSKLLKMSIKYLESVVLIYIIRHCEMAEETGPHDFIENKDTFRLSVT